MGLSARPTAFLTPLLRVVSDCPEGILLPRHEVVDPVLEHFQEDKRLAAQIRIIVRAREYDLVPQIEEHDKVSAPASQKGFIAAAKARVEPDEESVFHR